MAVKRRVVGSFCKSKDDSKPPYIKFRDAMTIGAGDIVRVESKKYQLASLDRAVAEGKLSGDVVGEIRDRIEKIPEWVLGEIVQLQQK